MSGIKIHSTTPKPIVAREPGGEVKVQEGALLTPHYLYQHQDASTLINAQEGDLIKRQGSEWVIFTPNYLTVESDPVFVSSPAYQITVQDIIDWDTAYVMAHPAVSLGAAQNGLSLAGQVLQMAAAGVGQAGAVSTTDQTFEGNKTFKGQVTVSRESAGLINVHHRINLTQPSATGLGAAWDVYSNTAAVPDFFGRIAYVMQSGFSTNNKQFQLFVADASIPAYNVNGSGNFALGIGFQTANGRLHIRGNNHLSGNAALVENWDGVGANEILRIENARTIRLNGSSTYNGSLDVRPLGVNNRVALLGNIEIVQNGTGGSWSGQWMTAEGANRTFRIGGSGSLNASDISSFLFSVGTFQSRTTESISYRFTGGNQPITAQAYDYTMLDILVSNINANSQGINRAVRVRATAVDNTVDFRAFSTDNNYGYAFYAQGAATSYFGGYVESQVGFRGLGTVFGQDSRINTFIQYSNNTITSNRDIGFSNATYNRIYFTGGSSLKFGIGYAYQDSLSATLSLKATNGIDPLLVQYNNGVTTSQYLQLTTTGLLKIGTQFVGSNATLVDVRGSGDGDTVQIARTTTTDRFVRLYASGRIDARSPHSSDAAYLFQASAANPSTSGTRPFNQITGWFVPTSGNAEWINTLINPIINQSSGANGKTAAIKVDASLTNAAEFYAFWSTRGNIRLENLPVSSAGLSSGSLWNDAGTVKIV